MRTESSPEASTIVAVMPSRTIASRSDSVTKSASSGIAEEADRRAVAGVEDDAVVDRDVLDRFGEVVGEAGLEANLLGDRLLRIADQVDEHDAANERSVGLIEHRATLDDGGSRPLFSCGKAVTYKANFGQLLVYPIPCQNACERRHNASVFPLHAAALAAPAGTGTRARRIPAVRRRARILARMAHARAAASRSGPGTSTFMRGLPALLELVGPDRGERGQRGLRQRRSRPRYAAGLQRRGSRP